MSFNLPFSSRSNSNQILNPLQISSSAINQESLSRKHSKMLKTKNDLNNEFKIKIIRQNKQEQIDYKQPIKKIAKINSHFNFIHDRPIKMKIRKINENKPNHKYELDKIMSYYNVFKNKENHIYKNDYMIKMFKLLHKKDKNYFEKRKNLDEIKSCNYQETEEINYLGKNQHIKNNNYNKGSQVSTLINTKPSENQRLSYEKFHPNFDIFENQEENENLQNFGNLDNELEINNYMNKIANLTDFSNFNFLNIDHNSPTYEDEIREKSDKKDLIFKTSFDSEFSIEENKLNDSFKTRLLNKLYKEHNFFIPPQRVEKMTKLKELNRSIIKSQINTSRINEDNKNTKTSRGKKSQSNFKLPITRNNITTPLNFQPNFLKFNKTTPNLNLKKNLTLLNEKNNDKYNFVNTDRDLKQYLKIQNQEFKNMFENFQEVLDLSKQKNKNFLPTFLNPKQITIDQENKLKQIKSKIGFGSFIKETKDSTTYRSSLTNVSNITPLNRSLRTSMNSNKKSTDKKIEFNRELQVTKPDTPNGVSNERITTKNLINEKIKFKKSEQKVIENMKIILKSFKKEGFIK